MMEIAILGSKDAGPFGEQSPRFDFCLEVEGKKLFAPKAVLSLLSPVFDKFCYDESFTEAKEGRVVLEGEKYEEILTMLKCCVQHPLLDEVTEKNVESLLKLANCYLIRFLQDACIRFVENRLSQLEIPDKASLSYLKIVANNRVENEFDSLIGLLIRHVSNLSLQTITASDADLPPDIGHKLFRHISLKYQKGRHSVEARKDGGRDFCKECKSSRQLYLCDLVGCNSYICSKCLCDRSYPRTPCTNAGNCCKCQKRLCLCEF